MKTLIQLGASPIDFLQMIDQITVVFWYGLAAVVGIIALAVYNSVRRV